MKEYTLKKKILLGIIIGLALIIPGVSASSLCISFKIYNDIIYKLSKIKDEFISSIKFLFPILLGLIIGVILGFVFIKALLNILPLSFILLFAGIMLGTINYKYVNNYKRNYIFQIIIGILFPVIICILSYKTNTINNLLLNYKTIPIYILLGVLISLLELIPGTSSSAILMSLGYYNPLINSLSIKYIINNKFIILIYLLIILGIILGIIFVSKLINNLLKKCSLLYLTNGLTIGSVITLFINKSSYNLFKSFSISNNIHDLTIGIILFIVSFNISFKLSNKEGK